ncbi:hypothetical protein [Shewanella baltica]
MKLSTGDILMLLLRNLVSCQTIANGMVSQNRTNRDATESGNNRSPSVVE